MPSPYTPKYGREITSARSWHALSKPAQIASRADIAEIDMMIARVTREMESLAARHVAPDARSIRDGTLRRQAHKLNNLERARLLWLREFQQTEGVA